MTFATAGPKINTGMKTSAQLQAHKSLGEIIAKGAESKQEIILNYINSCFTQSSKCGWVQWSHHKKINIYAHTGSGNVLRMAQVQHDSPNEEIMKAKSFQPKNRGPGDSYDPT